MERPHLFGIHPQIGTMRADHCGALVLTERPAEYIVADQIGFGLLAYYRTQIGNPHPRLRGVPIWAFKG